MKTAWLQVNQALLAKSIGELSYEQILSPTMVEGGVGRWREHELKLASGVSYTFLAWRTIWDHLRVLPGKVKRNGVKAESAGQFFIDSIAETGMSELTLGVFLEEMHNTLYADLSLAEKNSDLEVDELSAMSGEEIQTWINGHPKLLLNKGRMGWSAEDLAQYSPEANQPVRLFWLAVRGPSIELSSSFSTFAALEEGLSPSELLRFRTVFPDLEKSEYQFLPVHPWQWRNVVQVQFAGEIALGHILPLGEFGDEYLPQISLRTLSNISRPEKPDLKLPLSVLNTSAIRGISPKYISSIPSLSLALQYLCAQDSELAHAQVLSELAGISFAHPTFAAVKGAPYRYHETLAAIWRRSSRSFLASDESTVITGALSHQDESGGSLIGSFIARSQLGAEEWLRRYFQCVVIPLYHLQAAYGIGLVSHGQNIVLRMKNFAPSGIFLKDFQGDLRISAEQNPARAALLGDLESKLEKLPPHYLIHDLVTGHFVTVLRFISAALSESSDFPEDRFYAIMAQEIRAYLGRTKISPDPRIDLLAETFPRVLVNKVRFQIGYGDSAERPRPALGGLLKNPLHSLEATP